MAVLNDGNTLFWGKVSTDYMTVSNDSISEWKDYLGGSVTLTASGDARPVIISDSIYFDGTDDYLYYNNTDIDQPLFFYIVLSQQSWTDNDGILGGWTSQAVNLYQTYLSPGIRAYAGSPSDRMTDLDVLEKGIVRCLFNGTNSLLIINKETGSTNTDFGTNDPNGVVIGATAAGHAEIAVWEVIIRKAADTEADQSAIIDYLQSKHGL